MYPLKLIFSVIVLSLGISGAVYVIKNYQPVQPQAQNQLLIKNNNLIRNDPFVEQLSQKNLTHPSFNDRGDLTSELSQNLAQALVEINPNGPAIIDNQKTVNLPDLEEILNNLSKTTLKQIDFSKSIVNNADLNISDANTESALNAYIDDIQQIIGGSDEKIINLNRQYYAAIEALYQENGQEAFNNFIQDIQKINTATNNEPLKNLMSLSRDHLSGTTAIQKEMLGRLYQVAVPVSALEFHKNLLSYLLARQKILAFTQDPAIDPLIALESQRVLENINTELSDLVQNQLPNLKNNL